MRPIRKLRRIGLLVIAVFALIATGCADIAGSNQETNNIEVEETQNDFLNTTDDDIGNVTYDEDDEEEQPFDPPPPNNGGG